MSFPDITPDLKAAMPELRGRLIANHMQAKTGTAFVVENMAGAGGNIGAPAVARAAPDGYTFLVGTVSTHAINPFLYAKMPHDTLKDFQPVSLFARLPNMLVVNPKLPAKDTAEFIAYLKLAALPDGVLSARSRLIMLYAMCGFANLGSVGIMIAAISGMVPERRHEVVELSLKALIAGTLASGMTGAVVGLLPAF